MHVHKDSQQHIVWQHHEGLDQCTAVLYPAQHAVLQGGHVCCAVAVLQSLLAGKCNGVTVAAICTSQPIGLFATRLCCCACVCVRVCLDLASPASPLTCC